MVSAANDTTVSTDKKVVVWEIRSRDRKRFGRVYPGEVTPHHHAEIVPGASVRLFGMVKAGSRYVKGPNGRYVPCDDHVYCKDFKLGDEAVYGSYNMVYTGTIRAITVKTVTIVDNERVHRLDLADFDQRNWNFDADEIARRNLDVMTHC